MKKNLFAALALCVGMTACNPDDKDDSAIVGTWQAVSVYEWDKEDGEIVYEDTYYADEDGTFLLIFKSNGTGTSSDGESFKWSHSGGKLKITYTDDGDTWTETMNVEKLTADKLVISEIDSETYEGVKYEYYYEMTFERVN